MMEEMIKEQDAAAAAKEVAKTVEVKPTNGNGNGTQKAAGSKCPFASAMEKSNGNTELYLNEVGLMQELDARKKKN